MKTLAIFLYATQGIQDTVMQFLWDNVPGLFVLIALIWGAVVLVMKVMKYVSHNHEVDMMIINAIHTLHLENESGHNALKVEIKHVDGKVDQLEQKFDDIARNNDKRFDQIDEKFEKMDQKFEEKFEKLEIRFTKIDQKFEKMDDKLDRIIEMMVFHKREAS